MLSSKLLQPIVDGKKIIILPKKKKKKRIAKIGRLIKEKKKTKLWQE